MTTEVAPSERALPDDAVHHHTIIIGAGPAGLAVGACLKQAGLSTLILEQADRVGASWHQHYERLHLHTAKAFSGLPFFPFPKEYPRYPARLQVISYLEAYARQFELEIRFAQKVIAARYLDGYWEVRTQDTRYQAKNLVVASGYTREPLLPSWPGQASFQGTLMHSSQYRNGEPFKNRNVLVVGFGNSAGEIAIDLWEHGARPALAVRGPVNIIPRELFGIPNLAISILEHTLPAQIADALNSPILRAVIADLKQYGLQQSSYGPQTQIQKEGRIPLIDVGTLDLIKRGHIGIYPGIKEFTPTGVIFADGKQADFEAAILATGYLPRVNTFLEGVAAAYDEKGTPLASGQELPVPGLYFCGYYVSPTGMLREIAREARQISAAIARKSQARR